MMVSTRGRYALRVMIDLAENDNGECIPMKDVARRQGLPFKYLEKIVPVLTRHNLIEGVHGKGGGYRLTRSPDQYNVWDILVLTENDLAPVVCVGDGAEPCLWASECRTLPMWQEFYQYMRAFFEKKTIADLMTHAMEEKAI